MSRAVVMMANEMGIVRTVEWRMVVPLEEARVQLCAAAQQLGMDTRSMGDRVVLSSGRAWRQNRWAAEIEITLRASPDETTVALCRVEMAGNKHYEILNELAAALGDNVFDDRGVGAAVEALGKVRQVIGRKQIRRLPDLLLADERVLVLGQGIYRSKQGLVVLTNRRLFVFQVGMASESLEEFGLASITSLESAKSPGGETLVIHASNDRSEIKQLFHGQADAIVRHFREHASAGRGGAPAPATPAADERGPVVPDRPLDIQDGVQEPRSARAPDTRSSPPPSSDTKTSTAQRDLFISHASEDKETVARPLAAALTNQGWTVWLDELELTIGDSLSGRIDQALATSRFGVVVLSPAFFAKPWPQRELAGLAAREVSAGSKVILPVWHELDHDYILARSPTLADRLGANTKRGVDAVADEIGRALSTADNAPTTGSDTLLQSVIPADPAASIGVPRNASERARLLADRPELWEYRFFAAVLQQGRVELEPKSRDNMLGVGDGPRLHLEADAVLEHCRREVASVREQGQALMRVFDPATQEVAFGAPGEHGDPAWIEHLGQRVIRTYDELLDAAASIRNTTVPEAFQELRDVTAEFIDQPITCIRRFIDDVMDQMSRVPELLARPKGAEIVELNMTLTIEIDPAVTAKLDGVMTRLNHRGTPRMTRGDRNAQREAEPGQPLPTRADERPGGPSVNITPARRATPAATSQQTAPNRLAEAGRVVYRHPVKTLTIPWLVLAVVGAMTDSESAVLLAPWSVLFFANIGIVGVKTVRWLVIRFAGSGREP